MRSLLAERLHAEWVKDPTALTAVRIRRKLSQADPPRAADGPTIRAAFIGSFTLDTIRDTFEVACLAEGIRPATFLGQYRQYPQEILNPDSPLYAHAPEITFLALDPWAVFDDLHAGAVPEAGQTLAARAAAFLDEFVALLEQFDRRDAGLLVIHNLEVPAYDVAGIHALTEDSITVAVRHFNGELLRRTRELSRVYVLDYDQIAARIGKDAANDEKLRLLGRFCVGNAAVPALVQRQMAYVKAAKGLTRKCIVLDLDNTLWGGIVGEDGFDGIALGSTPPGNAFVEFQRALLALQRRGIILAINSRNNPDDALRVLRDHPYQVLREEHFAALAINWGDKASNLTTIASELNIGLDALAFIDDDPHNRALVRDALPQVLTPDWPADPALFGRALLQLNDFESLALTAEDRQRGQMYAAERQRREVRGRAPDLETFLANLQIKVKVLPADAFAIPRIAQLTQRTNQFNMTTRRYTDAQIEVLARNKNTRVYYLSASDRFDETGIVGVAVVTCAPQRWDLDTLLMSCRVLGRRIEDAFVWWIANEAQRAGATQLRGELLFTKKNLVARGFYEGLGFTCARQDEQGQTWVASVAELARRKPAHIQFV